MLPSPTVLLAEDEPIIASEISAVLAEKGCRVILASGLQELTDACGQQHPDLVILNFRQPALTDGMAIARMLQQHFRLSVLFVTGACPQDIAASKDFDASLNILYKPFTRAQLQQFLDRWSA